MLTLWVTWVAAAEQADVFLVAAHVAGDAHALLDAHATSRAPPRLIADCGGGEQAAFDSDIHRTGEQRRFAGVFELGLAVDLGALAGHAYRRRLGRVSALLIATRWGRPSEGTSTRPSAS